LSDNLPVARHEHAHAAVLRAGVGHSKPELCFNYLTDRNDEWNATDLQKELKYTARYNTDDGTPLVVQL